MMIGAFGNENMGFGDFDSTAIGDIPSYNIWQDKAYAYATGDATIGFNPTGKYLWENSLYTDGTISSIGAVYSNPYDDRFGNGVFLPIDSNGGTFTVQLFEIVPEPSSAALLAFAGGLWALRARSRQRKLVATKKN
jgi:hypothetical protein